MDSEQVKQLVAYLSNQNPKVKAQALDIVFQLTGAADTRKALKQPELTKQLLRGMPEIDYAEKSLATLINFSQDQDDFVDDVLEQNGIQRIIDSLKEYLIEYSKSNIKSTQTSEKDKDVKKKEDSLLQIIQLQLLLLSNLSQNDEVKKRILEMNREPEFHGLTFTFMLSWFNHPTISPTFHFFANIIANLSSIKETREFILKPELNLLENIVPSVFSIEPNRRLGVLRTIRNCIFEYENPATLEYLIKPKIDLINSISKCMLFNNIRGLSSDPDFDKELEEVREVGKKQGLRFDDYDESVNMGKVLEEMELLIDIFLITTNIDPQEHKMEYDTKLLKFNLVNAKLFLSSESIKDKIDVIAVQMLKETLD